MRVRSTKDYAFIRNSKSIVRCVHRYKKVTKSYIPVVNASAWIEIPKGQSENEATNESKTCLKRSRPIGFNSKADKHDDTNMEECVPKEAQNKTNQDIETLKV